MKSEINDLTELHLIFMVTGKEVFKRAVDENNKIVNFKLCFKLQISERQQEDSPYLLCCHG